MSAMGGLAVLLLAAGVIAALLGILIAPNRPRIQAGLGIMLDLWLAAALLQLAGEPRWSTIGTSALLVALRMLLRASIAHAG